MSDVSWGGGVLTQKNSHYKIGKLALVFICFFVSFGFLKFPNWHWFFFCFFGIGFGQNSNWKLVFLAFFWVFLFFFFVFLA